MKTVNLTKIHHETGIRKAEGRDKKNTRCRNRLFLCWVWQSRTPGRTRPADRLAQREPPASWRSGGEWSLKSVANQSQDSVPPSTNWEALCELSCVCCRWNLPPTKLIRIWNEIAGWVVDRTTVFWSFIFTVFCSLWNIIPYIFCIDSPIYKCYTSHFLNPLVRSSFVRAAFFLLLIGNKLNRRTGTLLREISAKKCAQTQRTVNFRP